MTANITLDNRHRSDQEEGEIDDEKELPREWDVWWEWIETINKYLHKKGV